MIAIQVKIPDLNWQIKNYCIDKRHLHLLETIHYKGMYIDWHNVVCKYHNLYIKTPCLMWPFCRIPTKITIDKFNCIQKIQIISSYSCTCSKLCLIIRTWFILKEEILHCKFFNDLIFEPKILFVDHIYLPFEVQ